VKTGDRVTQIAPFAASIPTIHTEGADRAHGQLRGPRRRAHPDELPAREIVERMATEAEAIITQRLPRLVG